jgi:thiamine-phosphate pyrophosphorylase
LARHLKFQGRTGPVCALPPLALLTDTRRLADPLPTMARLPPGSLVVLRHYDWPERAALAARMAKACRARRLCLVVGGDVDLAVALGVGLHLPEGMVPGAPVKLRLRHRKRPGLILSAAAHSRMALTRARRLGVDAAFLSPVFSTLSHPGKRGLGLLTLRRLTRGAPIAIYALGGVTARTVCALAGSGIAGIATVGGLDLPGEKIKQRQVLKS